MGEKVVVTLWGAGAVVGVEEAAVGEAAGEAAAAEGER